MKTDSFCNFLTYDKNRHFYLFQTYIFNLIIFIMLTFWCFSLYFIHIWTKNLNKIMITIFIISVTLMWLFGFLARVSYCFKEQYKRFYTELFEKQERVRPHKWRLSRQKNHDIFSIFRFFTFMFAGVALLFGAISYGDIMALIAIFTLPLLIVLPLGEAIGIYACNVSVKKECKKFKIQYKKL